MLQPSDDYNRQENYQHAGVDDFEQEQRQQALQKRILEHARAIPVFLNDINIFNAVMFFSDAAKQPPINVRNSLKGYITDAYNGGPQRTKINRVKIWTEKGFLFLDYQNEKPELNNRLSMSVWPVVHLLHMTVTKDDRPEARPVQVTRDDLQDAEVRESVAIANQDPDRPEPAAGPRGVSLPRVTTEIDGNTVQLEPKNVTSQRKPGEHIGTYHNRMGGIMATLTPDEKEEFRKWKNDTAKRRRDRKKQEQQQQPQT